MAKQVAVAPVAPVSIIGGTQLPDYLKDYKGPMGNEDIETKDISVPRLKIGQSMSPLVKSKAIEEGALYLSITNKPLWTPGDKPLIGVIVAQNKEFILWRPRQDGNGGLLARAKPVKDGGVTRYHWDKPNAKFDVKVKGVVKASWETIEFIDQDGLDQWGSEIPGDVNSGIAATAHHNYVLFFPGHDGLVAAVSMSRSQVKKAKDVNANLKLGPKIPIFARLFSLETVTETSGENQYKNWAIQPAGTADKDTADAAFQWFSALNLKGFTVDQSGEEDTEVSEKI